MLDRSIAPYSSSISSIQLPSLSSVSLTNGIKIHYLINPSLQVFRLEIIFSAGSYFGEKFGQSFFVSKTLNLGTSKKSAKEVAEEFEKLGGFLEISQNLERLNITLHGLSAFFKEQVDNLLEIIADPTFPEDELKVQKNISKQSLMVNLEKTSFEANRIFRSGLYGDHVFGKSLGFEDIDEIERNDLISFFEKNIRNSGFEVFISGNFTEADIEYVSGQLKCFNIILRTKEVVTPGFFPKFKDRIDKEGNIQCSLRLGKRMINRKHPDFYKFMVTNTILGGYFGSRLMKNIREEKGLTYGISSVLTPMGADGIWNIGADVNKDNLDLAEIEIEKEIANLKEKGTNANELNLVKSYINGSILNSMNTVFEAMDKHKALIFEGLPICFYDDLIDKILEVKEKDVLEIANKYFDDYSIVIVG
ncbi:MAG: pitrilysin family protein [Spirosomataceae bacterium]|jgi:predicted Zn-dependent peptidase